VKLSNGNFINTVKVGKGSPLVLVHGNLLFFTTWTDKILGFGAGVGFWVCNLKELSQKHTVYAIDLLGFGRSSRTPYTGKTTDQAEAYFVDSIEEWRKAMNLQKFHLLGMRLFGELLINNILGHSFGGYLSSIYTLKHPESVHHLLLADP